MVAPGVKLLNKPEAVSNAINKAKAFELWSKVEGLRIPPFYTSADNVPRDRIILARSSGTGSGGDDITVVRPGEDLPDVPLYVGYIPKTQEYRVHVANGKAIFVQQKKRRSEAEQTKDEKLLRNHANGWVFCPLELDDVSPEIKDAAVMAVHGLGLCFGACDIILGRDDGAPYVLECNTCPGITSPTLLNAYKKAFESWLV